MCNPLHDTHISLTLSLSLYLSLSLSLPLPFSLSVSLARARSLSFSFSVVSHDVKGMYGVGWLQLVGSLKIKFSFAKEPYKRDLYSAKENYLSFSLFLSRPP